MLQRQRACFNAMLVGTDMSLSTDWLRQNKTHPLSERTHTEPHVRLNDLKTFFKRHFIHLSIRLMTTISFLFKGLNSTRRQIKVGK